MRPGGGLTTRRTLGAWAAAAAAGVGAVLLAASEPAPAPVSPPAPVAAADVPEAPGRVRLPPADRRPAAPPVALTAAGDGALLWAERGTGVVRRARPAGDALGASEALARLAVAPGPEAGVRGLAVDRGGRVFAAYVRAQDDRLVVAEISRPQPRLVWRGPLAGRARVGGGLVALAGGRLALGVGDQVRPRRAATSFSVLGRVVTLDPDGRPQQEPHRRSRGWHDPVALARGRGGALWVADRAGAGQPERVGRADRPRAGTVRSGVRRVPSGLAAADDGRVLFACGLRSGRVDRTFVRGAGTGNARTAPQVLAPRCRYGITAVEGRLWASGDDGRIAPAGTTAALDAARPLTD